MGVERCVTFAAEPPTWDTVRRLLAERGFPVQLRMIDGELAFPDEEPPDAWRELRLGTPQGMVTLRRDGTTWRAVTWGNADAVLLQAWNAVAWAVAVAGGGTVATDAGPRTGAAFAAECDLPTILQTGIA